MSELHRRLLLDLPERRAPKAGDFSTDAKSVRAWVGGLPLANFAATARMLVDALRSMNRLKIGAGERLEALEILRAPVAQLAGFVDRQIVGASFPLPPQRAELGTLSQEFQHELASGYRLVLHDLCAPDGHVPMLRGKLVALAATRALVHAGARLHKAYLLYRTAPKGAWQALHDLYRFIASTGLETRAVDDAVLGAPISACTAYVHALLLALCNPYRFTQRELLELIPLTCALAPYARLGKEAGGSGTLHPVDTSADCGPGYLPEERTPSSAGVFFLDIDGLVKHIEGQIAHAPAGIRLLTFRMRGGPPIQVEVETVRRLISGWTSDGTRENVRLPAGYVMQSVIGFHDLHYMLAGGQDFEGFLRRIRGTSIQMSEREDAAAWTLGAGENMRSQPLPVRVRDQGLGGYRVLWERGGAGETVRAKIGDMIGLALVDGEVESDWMVGVIRWMRIDDEGHVDAGVNLLARRGVAVGVNAVTPEGDVLRDRRGILLAPLHSEEISPYSSLLTPALFEKEMPSFRVTLPVDPNIWLSRACALDVEGAELSDVSGAYLRFALPELELPATDFDGASTESEFETA